MGDPTFLTAPQETLSSSLQRASGFVAKTFEILHTSVTVAAAKLGFVLSKNSRRIDPLCPESQPKLSTSCDVKLRLDITKQLEPWRQNSTWVDDPPLVEVTVPKGSLCKLDCIFKVGIPPDAVFDIITDPENKRVFKNIQRVNYRKVLRDEGSRQLVEVEQEAIWRFLWLTGTLTVRVLVDQDYDTHSLSFRLAKEGFMKRFEGSWNLQPLYVDPENRISSSSKGCEAQQGRVASLVKLQQIVQPALIPPPPFSWYIRGITTKTIEVMIQDLQAEGKNIRERKFDQEHGPTTKPQPSTAPPIPSLSRMKAEWRRKAYWSNKKKSRWDIVKPER